MTHDVCENTWKCGEFKLYFSPSTGGETKLYLVYTWYLLLFKRREPFLGKLCTSSRTTQLGRVQRQRANRPVAHPRHDVQTVTSTDAITVCEQNRPPSRCLLPDANLRAFVAVALGALCVYLKRGSLILGPREIRHCFALNPFTTGNPFLGTNYLEIVWEGVWGLSG